MMLDSHMQKSESRHRRHILHKNKLKMDHRCGEKGTLLHFGGNVNWYSHYEEQYGGSLKN